LKVFAILLDTRPGYLDHAQGPASLLLAPLGPATVLRYLAERLSSAGHPRLTIATDFPPGPDYERRIGDCGARVDAIVPARDLAGRIADYEPSDWLVIVDPRCTPSAGLDPRSLVLEGDGGPRRVRHLVVLEAHPGGTTERVQLGANGTVDRIQRFYDSATWPFTSGVACSVLPVSCTLWAGDLPFNCLRDLRRSLAELGVPSHDVFLRGGAFDLTRERDLLGLSERVVLEHFRGGAGIRWVAAGRGCRVDPTARLIGPVVLQDRVVIGPEATVVGPAVIGSGTRVERGAMVAQCVVGPDSTVAPGLTLRHRAVFGTVSEAGRAATPAAIHDPEPPPAEPAEVEDKAPRSPAVLGLKAAFDVTAAALGLLVLSPLLLLIAVLVKLESKGPVFYGDRREGQGGRVFKCLKFRTMCAGADAQQRELLAKNEVDGPQFKLARDPRVTRLGRVLRLLNLDELPQLINVLRLEMSLVGPRPSPFRENQLCIPWREARLSVRPGITGLWQICRNRRLQGDFHQWIHFDLLYVEHASFPVDVKILAATVLSLAGQWPVPLSWIIPSRDLAPAGSMAPTTPIPNLSRSEGLI
jgi:lipopolysaccharide/colanic/teichoic acid biosynthesis glycosyltransferase